MPRYVIERTFPNGLEIPMNAKGAEGTLKVVGRNAEEVAPGRCLSLGEVSPQAFLGVGPLPPQVALKLEDRVAEQCVGPSPHLGHRPLVVDLGTRHL